MTVGLEPAFVLFARARSGILEAASQTMAPIDPSISSPNGDLGNSGASHRLEETLPTEGRPTEGADPTDGDALERGATLGRYTVLDRIGAGGMGVVYAAFDPQLDRKVALKVMHPGGRHSDGRSHGRSRLLREAQAMAKLAHPNVIAVHDVGTFGKRVFVAMEFVDGPTLRQWLETPREWQDTVDAFVRAGRGLASAHAAGLVHRDFKPDNVLMGNDGRVLVMDFGLARQASNSAPPTEPHPTVSNPDPAPDIVLTRTGAALGTPAYMAPEQHTGAGSDARVDQFSFCVALYEGLYGERPFGGNSVASLALNVLEGKVKHAPRGTRVPSWLRQVIVRGLSVDPSERFPSMDALLAELQRDPPQSRSPWIAIGILGGLLGVSALAYFASRPPLVDVCPTVDERLAGVWDDGQREIATRAFAVSGLPYAEVTWASTATELDRYTAAWGAQYREVCLAEQQRRATEPERSMPGVTAQQLACLDTRLGEVRALVAVFTEADPTVVRHALGGAQSLTRLQVCTADRSWEGSPGEIGSDPSKASRRQSVIEGLAQARALSRTGRPSDALVRTIPLVDAAAAVGDRGLQAEALVTLADAQDRLGEPEAAEKNLRQAVLAAAGAGRAAVEAEAWVMTVRVAGRRRGLQDHGLHLSLAAQAAIERAGDDPILRARVDASIGHLHRARGEYATALQRYDAALTTREDRIELQPLQFAGALDDAAAALAGLRRYAEAADYSARAAAVRERVLGMQHPLVARSLADRGAALVSSERDREAEAVLTQARLLLQPQVDDDGDSPIAEDQALLGRVFDRLGQLMRGQQRHAEAQQWLQRAIDTIEAARGPKDRAVAYPVLNLGVLLTDQDRHLDALPHLTRAVEIWSATLDPDHPDLGIAHLDLAHAKWSTGAFEEARDHYAKALISWERSLAPDHPLVAYALTGLGRAELSLQSPEKAIESLERALEIRDHEDEDPLNVAETALALGQAVWMSRQDPDRGVELATRARKIVGSPEPTDQRGLRRLLAGSDVPGFTDMLRPAGIPALDLAP